MLVDVDDHDPASIPESRSSPPQAASEPTSVRHGTARVCFPAAVTENDEIHLSVHDLRQPLTAILSAATALRADPSLDADTRTTLLNIVVENAARMSKMLENSEGSNTAGPPDRA